MKKKYQMGGELPSAYHASMVEHIGKRKKKKAQSGDHLHGVPESASDYISPIGQARREQIDSVKPMSWDYDPNPPRPINWGNVATDALLAFDAIIPPDKSRKPTVYPKENYTQYPYGTGSQAIYADGGKISTLGYREDSPDKYRPKVTIPSNHISMKNVNHPVLGVDNLGNSQMMNPGQDYAFSGSYVTEYPFRDNPQSGVIKPQKDVYNSVYQAGGIIPGLTGTMYSRNAYHSKEKITNKMLADDGKFIPYGNYVMQRGGELTPYQAANQEAKRFSVSRGLGPGENAHVDPNHLPTYVDEQGRPVTGKQYSNIPQSMMTSYVPNDIKELQWDASANLPYFTDPYSGDLKYTNKENYFSPRFMKTQSAIAPTRGTGVGATAIGYEDGGLIEAKDGHWIQKAVNPKHKGYCTPMTKSTCTPRRKALAKTFKKHHGFHKKAEDGLAMQKYYNEGEIYEMDPEEVQHLIRNGYQIEMI